MRFGQSAAAGKPAAQQAGQAKPTAKQSMQNLLGTLKHNLNKPALPHTATGKLDLLG